MNFSENIIEPTNLVMSDALVMYPFPVFGDIQNTGSRLQAMSDESGIPILASDLFFQKKKTIFDMSARQANQPEGDSFESMSQRRADFYTQVADRIGATVRIGMGDSLAVSAIQGMQLHGENEPFDALLLRDVWNLDKPTSVMRGVTRYARYQIKDGIQQRKTGSKFDIPDTDYKLIPPEENETSAIAKLRNLADIMRGGHNRHNAVWLARYYRVAMNVVTLTNGLSSENIRDTGDFATELRKAREKQHPHKHLVGLQVKQYPGWHSDLMDPARGAVDLRRTLKLLND